MNDMAATIDLNSDLGENAPDRVVADDAAMLAIVSSANVACGFHAGTPEGIRTTLADAVANGVTIGAHPGYRDYEGFGRRAMDIDSATLQAHVEYQLGALIGLTSSVGGVVRYVKPHGALYNRVVDDAEQAQAVLDGSGELPVLGLPGAQILRLAGEQARRVVPEGFPDRGYTLQGRLVPRDQPGALVEDPAAVAANAVRLARSGTVETICLHGDSPGAVQAARRVREALVAEGLDVLAWDR